MVKDIETMAVIKILHDFGLHCLQIPEEPQREEEQIYGLPRQTNHFL